MRHEGSAPEVVGVEDHGVWRGRRTWTVHVRQGDDRAAVSVVDLDTEPEVRAEAVERFVGRRRWTDDERAAMARTLRALERGLS